MRNILLSTTALTLTAGIAAADVSVSGSFKLGFNDTDSNRAASGTILDVAASAVLDATQATGVLVTAAVDGSDDYVAADTSDNNYGVYNDAGITFAMSSVMDNGMAASITADMNGGDTVNNAVGAYTLALASDGLNVTFGTTEYSAITNWKSAGDMGTDTWANQNADGLNVIRADVTLGGLAVSASANVTTGAKASPDPMSITVGGSLGGASYVIANEGSKMGISVSNALGGATITTAYSTAPARVTTTDALAMTVVGVKGFNATTSDVAGSVMSTSTGVKIAYPMGAITTTASYVMESVGTGGDAMGDSWNVAAAYSAGGTSVTFKTDESTNNSVEGSTVMGAATVSAGLADNLEDMYLAVSNPLGGGATIMASYAIDADGSAHAADEVGAGDYQEGLTVELSFKF
jgi:outer membrane protein OmpU